MMIDDELMAVISIPIDLYLKARYKGELETKKISRHCIKVLFEVFSLDSWDINRYQGYGILNVDLLPGMADRRVQIMKPKRSSFQKIKEYFIGGNYYIKNKKSFVFEENDEEHGELNLYNRIVEFNCELDTSYSVCQFNTMIKSLKKKEHHETIIRKEVMKNKLDLQSQII